MFDKGQKQSSTLSCDSSYFYIKVRYKGVFISQTCFPDEVMESFLYTIFSVNMKS